MYSISDIDLNQKIVRFVKEPYAKQLICDDGNNSFTYTFPIEHINRYHEIEDANKRDINDGKALIDLNTPPPGQYHIGNDILISCWSILDDKFIQLLKQRKSVHAEQKDNKLVAISTIKRVVSCINDNVIPALDKQKPAGYQHASLFLNRIHGKIAYYSPSGIPLSDWNRRADISMGVDMPIIQSIFHKHEAFKNEREYRFALICNHGTFYKGMHDLNFAYPEIINNSIYAEFEEKYLFLKEIGVKEQLWVD